MKEEVLIRGKDPVTSPHCASSLHTGAKGEPGLSVAEKGLPGPRGLDGEPGLPGGPGTQLLSYSLIHAAFALQVNKVTQGSVV